MCGPYMQQSYDYRGSTGNVLFPGRVQVTHGQKHCTYSQRNTLFAEKTQGLPRTSARLLQTVTSDASTVIEVGALHRGWVSMVTSQCFLGTLESLSHGVTPLMALGLASHS